MAAGEKCCAVGVIRLVLGDVFDGKQVVLEAHHGIEDSEGGVEYARLEECVLAWKKARSLVTEKEWDAVLGFIAACEKELMKCHKPAKGKLLKKFDEQHAGKPPVPFSPM